MVTLALMAMVLWKNRELLAQAFTDTSLVWLLASFLLYLLTSLVYVLIWHLVARTYGAGESFIQDFTTLSLVSAARYLPGAVWSFLGLMWLSNKIGVTKRSMVTIALTTQGLHLSIAFWLSCIGLILVAPSANKGESWSIALVVGFSSLLMLLLLAVYLRYFYPFLKKFNLMSGMYSSRKIGNLPLAGITSLAVWGLNGLRLTLLLYTFAPSPEYSRLPYLLFYCIWVSSITSSASNLFFFLPLGLGAVELSLLTLLGLVLPSSPTILLVVTLNRILQVANDLIVALYAVSRELSSQLRQI